MCPQRQIQGALRGKSHAFLPFGSDKYALQYYSSQTYTVWTDVQSIRVPTA